MDVYTLRNGNCFIQGDIRDPTALQGYHAVKLPLRRQPDRCGTVASGQPAVKRSWGAATLHVPEYGHPRFEALLLDVLSHNLPDPAQPWNIDIIPGT